MLLHQLARVPELLKEPLPILPTYAGCQEESKRLLSSILLKLFLPPPNCKAAGGTKQNFGDFSDASACLKLVASGAAGKLSRKDLKNHKPNPKNRSRISTLSGYAGKSPNFVCRDANLRRNYGGGRKAGTTTQIYAIFTAAAEKPKSQYRFASYFTKTAEKPKP